MRDNAMRRCLEQLSDQWGAFCEDGTQRLLYWQLTDAERAVFEAFLALESDEATAEHTTLFVELDCAFESPVEHGFALCQTLVDGCTQGADELMALGLATDFQLPRVPANEQDVDYLLRVCEAFLAFYEIPGQLALILRPRSVADHEAYALWLQRVALRAPSTLRLLVIDGAHAHPEDAVFPQLAAADPEHIVIRRAALNVPDALVDLSRQAGGLDTPGGLFRDAFVRMAQALGCDDLERALQLGAAAITTAENAALHQLAVPVHVALGSALIAAGRHDAGLEHCRAAEAAAQRGVIHEDPVTASTCLKLHLQSRVTHGTCLLAAGQLARAAEQFEQTAPLAADADDHALAMDCQRLAGFCYERQAAFEPAWRAIERALVHASALDPAARVYSSLPALSEAAERLAEQDRPAAAERIISTLQTLLAPVDRGSSAASHRNTSDAQAHAQAPHA